MQHTIIKISKQNNEEYFEIRSPDTLKITEDMFIDINKKDPNLIMAELCSKFGLAYSDTDPQEPDIIINI